MDSLCDTMDKKPNTRNLHRTIRNGSSLQPMLQTSAIFADQPPVNLIDYKHYIDLLILILKIKKKFLIIESK